MTKTDIIVYIRKKLDVNSHTRWEVLFSATKTKKEIDEFIKNTCNKPDKFRYKIVEMLAGHERELFNNDVETGRFSTGRPKKWHH